LIDTTKFVLQKYVSLNLEQIYKQNVSFAPFTAVKDDLKMSQEHWRKMFINGRKVGFISGVDKPKVIIDEKYNCRYLFSCPAIAAAVSPAMQYRNNPWEFDELFYWSPDFPKIPIKQAHIIKNFFKQNGIEKFKKSPRMLGSAIKQPPIGVFVLIQGNDYLRNEELNRLIYPYWYNIPYQYKALNLILYEKESWFINKMNSEEQAKNWKIITQKVLEITKTDYRKQSFFNNAIHSSKPYFLGE
jgi:hypothetical protein